MSARSRLTSFAINGGALTLVALVTYIVLAPRHIVDGDNAELTAVGTIGGRPHPSGYPAYVLYLRLMSWLPGSTPAHSMALATALIGVAVVFVAFKACRAWGASPVAASLATAMYAASPTVLRMHTQAEVFALNALVVATVLWLSASAGPVRGIPRVAALALVAGIGMGNHLTCVLIAPVGLLGAVRGIRETRRHSVVAITAAIGALSLGLATYAYLLVADGPISFGRVDGLRDVVDFFIRKDYGGPGAFVPSGKTVPWWVNLGALVRSLGHAYLWLPGVAGLAMLGARCVRRVEGVESRIAWACLAASFLVAGPLLALRFNIEPVGIGLYVCQRFHLLPTLLLVVPVALALDRGGTLAKRYTRPVLHGAGLGTAIAIAFFGALVVARLSWLRGVHSLGMEGGIRNMLSVLPPDAVVVANSEDLCFGADYVQHVTGFRPDVEVACWIVTSRSWYLDRLAKRGVPYVGPFSVRISKPQALAILAKRPLFVDRSMTDIVEQLPSYPFGTLIRILPEGKAPPSLHEVVELNQKMFASFDLDYPRPSRGDDFAAVAHKRYAATWVTLADALERQGDPDGAANARAVAQALAPRTD